ncbi:MAG: hypothetical protein JHC84_18055 [Solirubrobacteraceae bacterium]|nr:hypothetical protein [Solirubrobacteraceae bacterium]
MAVDPYAAELDAFVAQRKTLVAELRAAGDRAGAKTAAALRKPSVAAWAINQLVHRHGELVSAFRAAAAEARGAQVALAGGGDRDAWRAAMASVREAQGDLMDAVAELGVSTAARDGAEATLAAAAADEEVEADALSGRLVREVEPGGFGALLAADIPIVARPEQAEEPEEDDSAQAHAVAAAAAAAARERAEALEAARARLAAAEEALAVAERRRDEAAAAVKDARREVADLEDARPQRRRGQRS